MERKSNSRKDPNPTADGPIPNRHYRHNDSESPDTDNIDGHDPAEEARPGIDEPQNNDSLMKGRKTQDDDE
jgi:hypothetical protein